MIKFLRVCLVLIFTMAFCAGSALAGRDGEFKEKLLGLKWIAYAPTNFDPESGIFPPEDSLRQDLTLLYTYGFNGVVTYGADRTLAYIPRLAKEAGFKGVIMGVWDINSQEEQENAVLAQEYVDGYSLGNEGLNSRYDLETLQNAMASLKAATGKPVTTTEQVQDYANDAVFAVGDWIFPNIHPFLSEVKEPAKAARWIEKHYQRLNKHCSEDRVVLFKEVGYPTAGMDMATESHQEDFFLAMEKTKIPFVYFEAFDQRWKTNQPCEPHWGLFKSNRKPKKFLSAEK